MNNSDKRDMVENIKQFSERYSTKFEDGAIQHGGSMAEMGAYQALENMEQEVLDQWSYARQIRKTLDEIRGVLAANIVIPKDEMIDKISEILNRKKEDGK